MSFEEADSEAFGLQRSGTRRYCVSASCNDLFSIPARTNTGRFVSQAGITSGTSSEKAPNLYPKIVSKIVMFSFVKHRFAGNRHRLLLQCCFRALFSRALRRPTETSTNFSFVISINPRIEFLKLTVRELLLPALGSSTTIDTFSA